MTLSDSLWLLVAALPEWLVPLALIGVPALVALVVRLRRARIAREQWDTLPEAWRPPRRRGQW